MRSGILTQSLLVAGCVSALAFTPPIAAQAPAQQASPASPLSSAEITNLVKVKIAISDARDSADVQMAMVGNKKDEILKDIRADLRSMIDSIYARSGISEADYERKTYVLSTNASARNEFDSTMAKLTGVPIPGQVIPSGAAAKPAVQVPAGPAGVHIGHVMNSFSGTPEKQGLLPVALAEAKTAATHASLAAKSPTNLASMKLHAKHVMHAVDPKAEPKGPGLGYGVREAAQGVANHIALAAKAEGASKNIITHAKHVETAASSTVDRCDAIIALAKKIEASTDAATAAGLTNQLVSLTDQLTTGVDTNGDGKISWDKGEGGLQQAEQHMKFMLAGESGGR